MRKRQSVAAARRRQCIYLSVVSTIYLSTVSTSRAGLRKAVSKAIVQFTGNKRQEYS